MTGATRNQEMQTAKTTGRRTSLALPRGKRSTIEMKEVVVEYRELLTSEESIASVDRGIKLAVRIALGDDAGHKGKWYPLINRRLPALCLDTVAASNSQRAKNIAWILGKLRLRIDEHLNELPEDQYSLLMDTLLVLFHHAFFGFLPHLNGERDLLLGSFEAYSASLPRQSDRFQTSGLIQMEQGRWNAAIESFGAAVATTHSDQHDFMTRVQTMWLALMERKRIKDAFNFLMEVYPRVSRSDIDEMRGRLQETFEEGARLRGRKRA